MKTALVTGGTKGIGLAISKALLDQGYKVFITYATDQNNAEKIQAELDEKYKQRFYIIKKKIETEEDVNIFVEMCFSNHLLLDGLDVVVLNAGCTDRTSWKEMTWDQWMHVMNVNINAPAAMLRRLDNYVNTNGSILFISSDMSIYPHAASVPYTVSKAAVNGLTVSLVKEYEDRGIRVNAILPGFVDTPWQKNKPKAQKERICAKIALHRFAEPEEIAEIAVSIINSSYMNGTLVQVDGGYCYR